MKDTGGCWPAPLASQTDRSVPGAQPREPVTIWNYLSREKMTDLEVLGLFVADFITSLQFSPGIILVFYFP